MTAAASGSQPILGVHVAGTKVFLALRKADGSLRDSPDLQREILTGYANQADVLYDFFVRFRQLIRGCGAGVVAFLHTRSYQGWSYSDAFVRASLQSAVMMASSSEAIRYVLVRREDAASHLGLAGKWKGDDLTRAAHAQLGYAPKYWADRSLAFAAAAVAAVAEPTDDR